MGESSNSNSPPRPGRVNSIVTPEVVSIPPGHTVQRLDLETGVPLLTEETGEEFVQSSFTTALPAGGTHHNRDFHGDRYATPA